MAFALFIPMPTAQAAPPAPPSVAPTSSFPDPASTEPSIRRSARISALEVQPVYFKKKPAVARTPPKMYSVYLVYDRDAGDPEWYWVRWNGYKDDADDTAQHRANLVKDGLGPLCDHVDKFKEWQAAQPPAVDAEEGEICEEEEIPDLTARVRAYQAYLKKYPLPRTFTADEDGLCYVASLRRASELLGIDSFLPDWLLKKFFNRHPGTEQNGVTWQQLTKLVDMCNKWKKRDRLSMKFGGKRSGTNLIRSTLSGPLDITQIPKMAPGVYLCGAAAALEGHMFVIRWVSATDIRVYDSIQSGSRQFQPADYFWVTRWVFIRQCFLL